MTKLKLLGAAAALATVIATPVMAQEATQEPGAIGFNYPNSHYMTGGWGAHTPPSWTGRTRGSTPAMSRRRPMARLRARCDRADLRRRMRMIRIEG